MQLSRSVTRRRSQRASVAISAIATLVLLLSAASASHAQTLERVRSAGQLNLGYRADARPFSYWDESKAAAGYSVELCGKVADAVKAELGLPELKVEMVTVGNHERFLAVKQKRIDLLCGASTVTLSRRKEVSFSIPVFLGGIAAGLRKDAPAELRAALAGEAPQYRTRESLRTALENRTVSVRLGTTAETWVDAEVKALNIDAAIEPAGLHGDAIAAVRSRQADVLFGDRPILLDETQRGPGAGEVVILDRYFTYEPIALALERGDEEFRLLVDRTLSGLYRSGEIAAIYKKHFGEPNEIALALFSRAAIPD